MSHDGLEACHGTGIADLFHNLRIPELFFRSLRFQSICEITEKHIYDFK